MANYTLGRAVVNTAADIYETWGNPDVSELIIKPGTYDFNGITTGLTIDDNMSVKFVGSVTFQNVRLVTRTYGNTEWDSAAQSDLAVVSWSAPSWARSINTWSPSSDWMIFVRDAWYDIDSYTATTITPVIAYNGPALASHRHVLVKPTRNVVAKGILTIEGDAAPGPPYLILYGLAFSDVKNWVINVVGQNSSFSTTDSSLVRLGVTATQELPRITVRDFSISTTSGSVRVGIYMHFAQHVHGRLAVNHLEYTGAGVAGTDLWGFFHQLSNYNKFNVNVSGIFRNGSGSGNVAGIYNAATGFYSKFSGHSVAPDSTLGTESYYTDTEGGGSNDWSDLITRAA